MRPLLRAAGKWIALAVMLIGAGAGVMYYVQDYVERGVALDSVETTQEQDQRFQEQVEELTGQAKEDEQQIEQTVDDVEKPDEVADPWLVRYVKRLL